MTRGMVKAFVLLPSAGLCLIHRRELGSGELRLRGTNCALQKSPGGSGAETMMFHGPEYRIAFGRHNIGKALSFPPSTGLQAQLEDRGSPSPAGA